MRKLPIWVMRNLSLAILILFCLGATGCLPIAQSGYVNDKYVDAQIECHEKSKKVNLQYQDNVYDACMQGKGYSISAGYPVGIVYGAYDQAATYEYSEQQQIPIRQKQQPLQKTQQVQCTPPENDVDIMIIAQFPELRELECLSRPVPISKNASRSERRALEEMNRLRREGYDNAVDASLELQGRYEQTIKRTNARAQREQSRRDYEYQMRRIQDRQNMRRIGIEPDFAKRNSK